jgi:glycylpeptide N-tetradecanoyltransferase
MHVPIQACYSYYNFANTVPLEELIRNALILAKKEDFDVYNCLDLMDNESVFKVLQKITQELHFMVGDGYLNYYLYNWNLKKGQIKPCELAVVLV